CARASRLFLDRRRRRRSRQHPRAVLRRPAPRHDRYRLQIPAARIRRLLHLCDDPGHPAVAPAGSLRPRMTSATLDRRAAPAVEALLRRHRLRLAEGLPWLIAIAAYFVFPEYLALGSQILANILFALSLDLILGYAGIVTLGHAAFFGVGAYAAGLLAAHGWGEPISGLILAGVVAAVIGLASGAIILRTRALTLLMLTLMIVF